MDAVFSLWHDFRLRRDRPDSQSDLPMDFSLSSANRNSPLTAPWFGWNFLRGRQCALLQWPDGLKKKKKKKKRQKKERKKEKGRRSVRVFWRFFHIRLCDFCPEKAGSTFWNKDGRACWSVESVSVDSASARTPTHTHVLLVTFLECVDGSSGKFPPRNFMLSAPAPTAVVRGLLSVLVVLLYVLLSFDH